MRFFSSKHIFSASVVLAIVVPLSLAAVSSIHIGNPPPDFVGTDGKKTEVSDGGIDKLNPIHIGEKVTFTATATDPNGDEYYLAICKTDSITSQDSAPPICNDGAWAVSGITISGKPASVTYTAGADADMKDEWFAFVCDNVENNSACSKSKQGSGANGSPFYVFKQAGALRFGADCPDVAALDLINSAGPDSSQSLDTNITRDQIKQLVADQLNNPDNQTISPDIKFASDRIGVLKSLKKQNGFISDAQINATADYLVNQRARIKKLAQHNVRFCITDTTDDSLANIVGKADSQIQAKDTYDVKKEGLSLNFAKDQGRTIKMDIGANMPAKKPKVAKATGPKVEYKNTNQKAAFSTSSAVVASAASGPTINYKDPNQKGKFVDSTGATAGSTAAPQGNSQDAAQAALDAQATTQPPATATDAVQTINLKHENFVEVAQAPSFLDSLFGTPAPAVPETPTAPVLYGMDVFPTEKTGSGTSDEVVYQSSDNRKTDIYQYKNDPTSVTPNVIKNYTIYNYGDGNETELYSFDKAVLHLRPDGVIEGYYINAGDLSQQQGAAGVSPDLLARASAVVAKDQISDLHTNGGTNPVFTIPAPFAVDSAGNVIDGLTYEITGDNFNELKVVFTADSNAYPIVLDPTLQFTAYSISGSINASTLQAITGEASSFFGNSFASGDFNGDGKTDLAVGAPSYNPGSAANTGRVYIFYNDGSIPTTAATADVIITGETSSYFGYSLAAGDFNGDGRVDLAVSARYYFSNTGRAYIFYNDGSIPITADTADVIITGETSAGSYFGNSLVAGDFNSDGKTDLAVDAYNYSPNAGRVYIYYQAAGAAGTPFKSCTTTCGALTNADVIITGETSSYFGNSFASGDFNGDGKTDLAVGAQSYTGNQGRVYIYYQAAGAAGTPFKSCTTTCGALTNADVIITGESGVGTSRLGSSLVTGDFNGDGKTDIAVGATYYPNNTLQGRVYIYYQAAGAAGTPFKSCTTTCSAATNADVIITGETTDNWFGSALAAGDFNGDGKTDLAVGAYNYNYAQGRVYIYYQNGTPGTSFRIDCTTACDAVTNADIIITGEYGYFGITLATGDFNSDGKTDLAVGAYGYNSYAGKVYILYGKASDLVGTITGEASYNYFGTSIVAGDFNGDGKTDLAVGAWGYGSSAGRVYIFYNDGSIPTTVAAADVIIAGQATYDNFGTSLAAGDFNGDTKTDLVVGATGYFSGTGRVYIFYQDGVSWGTAACAGTGASPCSAQYADVIIQGESVESFGSSLAVGDFNGDTKTDLVVGVPGFLSYKGKVYIFYQDGVSWGTAACAGTNASPCYASNADVMITGTSGSDQFGYSLAAGDFNGDTKTDLAVGAYGYSSNAGGVYIFYQNGTVGTSFRSDCTTGCTTYSNASVIITGEASSQFGKSLATGDFNGDGKVDIAVGAPSYNPGSAANTGRVYIFYQDATLWGTSSCTTGCLAVNADVKITGESSGDYFGYSLASGDFNGDGNVDLAVGAYYYSSGRGRVYIFYQNGTVGTNFRSDCTTACAAATNVDVIITAESAASIDNFGAYLVTGDFNGDGRTDLAVGATGYNNAQGKVYLFYGQGGVEFRDAITGEANSKFGYSLASGDFNGDGKTDLAVGVYYYSSSKGRVYIFYNDGNIPTTAATADVIITGEATNDYFGSSLAAGDFNSDTKTDLAVGAYGYSGGAGTGRVYIYYQNGGTNVFKSCTNNCGAATNADVIITGTANSEFGYSLVAGDFNSDTKTDLVVGVPGDSSNRGRVYIFYQDATLWGTIACSTNCSALNADVIIQGESNSGLGSSLAAGDFNGDGKTDLAVSAVNYSVNTGIVYIFYQDATLWGTIACSTNCSALNADVMIPGEGGQFGYSLAAGDFNSDGKIDLAVGATGYSSSKGRVYIFYNDGSYPTTAATADVIITGEASSGFGNSLAAGDFNGDGKTDLAVGCYYYNNEAGRVYIFYQDATLWGTSSCTGCLAANADVIITGEASSDFGYSLAAGDFNGDTNTDLAVGANGSNTGKVYIFYSERGAPSAKTPITPGHTNQTTTSERWTWASGGSQTDYMYGTTNSCTSGPTSYAYWDESSLTANTPYTRYVCARNASGVKTSALTIGPFYTAADTPTTPGHNSQTTAGMNLTWSGGAQSSFIFSSSDCSVSGGSTATSPQAISGQTANTAVTRYVCAVNGDGDRTSALQIGPFYTSATTPGAPAVSNSTSSTIDVDPAAIAGGGEMAIYVSNSAVNCSNATGGGYVPLAGGALGTVAWQSEASWGAKTVTGLTGGTTYYVCVKARNTDNVETAFGTSATGTTLNLPSMTSLSIANTGGYTNSATPSITITYSGAAATYMGFSCNGGTNWSSDIAYASPTTAFNITSGATGCSTTNGSKTITARVKSADGYSLNTAFATINYDNTAPAISSFTASIASPTQILLTPAASDAGSGLNATPYYYTQSAGASCVHTNNSGYISTNPYTWGSLSANTQYSFDVTVRDALTNTSGYSTCRTLYTAATTPGAPTVSNSTSSTIDVDPAAIAGGGEMAIYVSNSAVNCSNATGGGYVPLAGGALGTVAWQSEASWGAKTVTGLTGGTTYYVCVKARNTDNVETAFGTSATGTTLSLPSMTSLSIANTGGYTNSATPSITITYSGAAATYMGFSCNGGTNWSSDIAYASPTTAFNITSGATGCTATNGSKTITARVKSADGYSLNTASAVINYDNTAPTVSAFTASIASPTQILLTPTASDSGSGLNASPYYYTQSAGASCSHTNNSGYISTNPYTWGSLSANTQYSFDVTVRDALTNASGYSACQTLYTSANTPTTANHTNQTATSMRWTWVSGGSQTDYMYGTTNSCTSGPTTNAYWDESSLLANTAYTRYVCSRNGDGVKSSALTIGPFYTDANTPITPGHTLTSPTAMQWSWASGGAQTDYAYGNTSSCATSTTTNAYWNESGLLANTAYTRYACARNVNGDINPTALTIGPFYTAANAPGAPTVNTPTATTLNVTPVSGGTEKDMSIYVQAGASCTYSGGVGYVQADGSINNSTEVFQTVATWGTKTVTGLSAGTQYAFCSRARNTSNDVTSSGVTTAVYTLGNAPTTPGHTLTSPTIMHWSWVAGGSQTDYMYGTTNSCTAGPTTNTFWDESWYSSSWSDRFKITPTAVNNDLYYDLANAPAAFWSGVRSDGGDIRVTKQDGNTEVPREVSGFDYAGHKGSLYIGTSGGTAFYVYYGNSSATEPAANATYGKYNVYESAEKAVFHLEDSNDSTSNGNSNSSPSSPTFVSGKLKNSASFVRASNQYLQLPANNDTELNNNYNTVAMWVNVTSVGPNGYTELFANKGGVVVGNTIFEFTPTNFSFVLNYTVNGYKTITFSSPLQNWYHLIMDIDRVNNVATIWANGVYKGQVSFTSYASSGTISRIGSNVATGNTGDWMQGYIDEYRIYNRLLSDTEKTTMYADQSNPATFWTTGADETQFTAVTGLSANTSYTRYVCARNSNGDKSSALTIGPFYTMANTPLAPTLSNPATPTQMNVTPVSGGAEKDVSIYVKPGSSCDYTGGSYVQANGSIIGSEVYQSVATWGTITVTGLSANTQYSFCSRARNGDNFVTAIGSAATAYTSANVPTTAGHNSQNTTSMNLTWASGGAQTAYYFSSSDCSVSGGSLLTSPQAVTGLTANTSVTRYVCATNGDGDRTSALTIGPFYTDANTPITPGHTLTSPTVMHWSWASGGSQTDYAYGTTSACLTGTTSSAFWDESSLTANTVYTRYACARNGNGDITPAALTIGPFYTSATTPGAPAVSNSTSTTIDVDPAAIAGGGEMAIYVSNSAVNCSNATGGGYVPLAGGALGTVAWQSEASWGVKTVTGLTGGTTYYVCVKARNTDNVETAFGTSATGTTLSLPSMTSLSIANTGGYTNSATPSITITYSGAAATYMGFSCNGGTNWSSDIAYASPTTAFNITSGATGCSTTNGSKTITARVKSADGYSLNTAFATINYDNTAPTVSAFTASIASPTQILLTPTATDGGSGLNATPYYYTQSAGASCAHTNNSGYISTNPYTWGSLSANTQYSFDVTVRDALTNASGYSACQTLYTAANTPNAPTVNTPALTTLNVTPVSGGAQKDMSIYVKPGSSCDYTGGSYVQANGSTSAGEVYQPVTTWGTVTVTGLSANTQYAFCTRARNGDSVVTSIGSATTAYTLGNIPTTPGHTLTSPTAMQWSWASGGAQTDYMYGTTSSCTSGPTTNAYWNESGLLANTSNTRYVCARNGDGVKTSALTIGPFYTAANTPNAPTVNTPTLTTLNVNPVTGGTEQDMSIYVETGSSCDYSGGLGYVQANGSINNTTEVYQSDATWSTVTVTGLSASTQYAFCSRARNANSDVTAAGATTAVYTLGNTPGAPTVNTPTLTTLNVNPVTGGTEKDMSIYVETGSSCDYSGGLGYVQANGSISTGEIYQSDATWSTVTVTGLSANTQYAFCTRSRNGDNVVSSVGPAGTAYTSANVPTAGGHTNITTTGMRFTWTSGGAQTDYAYGTTSSCLDGITSNAYADISGLTANTSVTRYICARNGDSVKTSSIAIGPFYTSANIPGAPTISGATANSISVNPVTGGAEKEMAIYAATGSAGNCDGTNGLGYVQSDGSISGSAVWQSDVTWGTKTVTGLSASTAYYICSKARNNDNAETSFGTASSTNTIGPPHFNTGPSDGGSSPINPTNAGSNVAFTANATDNEGDNYYLAVCKTNSITPGDNAAPTCAASQTLCVSSSTASASDANCNFDTTGFVPETQVWYAFVCDKVSGGGLCSPSSQGTGYNGSPFKVNHAPTFSNVQIGPSCGSTASVLPGNSGSGLTDFVCVQAAVSDTDTDTTADTVDMHVCSTNGFSNGACTGTTLCTATGVASGSNAQCNIQNIVPIPTAKGPHNVYVFTKDSHGLQGAGTATQSYTVTDTPPVLISYTSTDTPMPVAGTSNTIHFSALIQDNNGENDITTADGSFFDSNQSQTWNNGLCVPDDKKCYNATCTLDTSAGTNTQAESNCSVTMWFDANASAGWKSRINPADSSGKVTTSSDSTITVENPPIVGVSIPESSLSYSGAGLRAGGVSGHKSVTLQNAGNQPTDISISGTNMTSGSNVIDASQQRWSTVPNFSYKDGHPLVVTPGSAGVATGCLKAGLSPRSSHTNGTGSDNTIYFLFKAPESLKAGTYTGTNTVQTTTCD